MSYLENTKLEIPKSRNLILVDSILVALNRLNLENRNILTFESEDDYLQKILELVVQISLNTIMTSKKEISSYL